VEVVIHRGVGITMRDGIRLLADVYAAADGQPRPVILQRTPYDRTDTVSTVTGGRLETLTAVASGFNVVVQDVRGCFGSEGMFRPFVQEADDGEDTIAWVAAQPFCTGQVALVGGSYRGAAVLLAASRHPEPIFAVAPLMTSAGHREGWTHRGGALELGFLAHWVLGWLAPAELARRPQSERSGLTDTLDSLADDPWQAFRMPPESLAEALHELAPYLRHWTQSPHLDPEPDELSRARLNVPGFHLAGWHDIFLAGTLTNYARLRKEAASPAARDRQRLVVGPWSHAVFGDAIGDRYLGPQASLAGLDLTRLQIEFFASVLRGETPPGPPVRLFVMGANRWRDEDEWPLQRAKPHSWYLGSDSRLNPAAPCDDPPASSVHHDPADPVPTVAGATFLPGQDVSLCSGPRDRAAVQARSDVLVFESEPIPAPLEITGPIHADLWIEADPAGADVVVALSEVRGDGSRPHVTDGILRLPPTQSPIGPQVVCVELDPASIVLSGGSRLVIEVAGSCFPRFDVHPRQRSRLRLFHDAARPSRVVLPTVQQSF
jgi:putative CocE/NonD family hydrolase